MADTVEGRRKRLSLSERQELLGKQLTKLQSALTSDRDEGMRWEQAGVAIAQAQEFGTKAQRDTAIRLRHHLDSQIASEEHHLGPMRRRAHISAEKRRAVQSRRAALKDR